MEIWELDPALLMEPVLVPVVIQEKNVMNACLVCSTRLEEILAMVTCTFYIHYQLLIVLKCNLNKCDCLWSILHTLTKKF